MTDHNHNHSHGGCCSSHGHNHNHEHGHKGCCGKHKKPTDDTLTHTEEHFLQHLIQYKYLPVVQFVVASTKETDFVNVALSPVFLVESSDTMEQVKNTGNKLVKLERLGFITLDYDIPLEGYSYDEYKSSQLFSYFVDTVAEAKEKENFLGDTAKMEFGSIAPTDKAIEAYGK